MFDLNWKDLFTNRDRRGFPEVVVPLASGSAPKNQDAGNDGSDSSLDRASLQENGTSGVHSGTTLTLQALRAEVEMDIAASGHDTVYDSMYIKLDLMLSPMNREYLLNYLNSKGKRKSSTGLFRTLVWAGTSGDYSSSAVWVGLRTSKSTHTLSRKQL